MPLPAPAPKVPTEAEHSASVVVLERVCSVCGRPRSAQRRETCSDRCRTALNRRRQQEALQARDQEIRAALEVIMSLTQVVLARLENRRPSAGGSGGV